LPVEWFLQDPEIANSKIFFHKKISLVPSEQDGVFQLRVLPVPPETSEDLGTTYPMNARRA
jgi:hypothetical protein